MLTSPFSLVPCPLSHSSVQSQCSMLGVRCSPLVLIPVLGARCPSPSCLPPSRHDRLNSSISRTVPAGLSPRPRLHSLHMVTANEIIDYADRIAATFHPHCIVLFG